MPLPSTDVSWWCPLPDLGLVVFEGADAAAFLQGQLSSDVAALAPGRGQWTSYNSPKGRVLANAWLWRSPGGERFQALVAADLAELVAKRLAMFVLRAKLRVVDATGAHRLFGIGGSDPAAVAASSLGAAPAPRHAGGASRAAAELVTLPDGRIVVIASEPAAEFVADALAASAGPPPPAARWAAADIAAGVPWITAATSDAFVLQMLNLDALDAVSFQKGCYPGQEVVARTRYLGRLKERMFALHADAPAPAAGTRLFSPVFGDQPCGTVVGAAAASVRGSDLLAVVQLAAAGAPGLALGAPDGPPLAVRTLPYALPEPTAPRGRVG